MCEGVVECGGYVVVVSFSCLSWGSFKSVLRWRSEEEHGKWAGEVKGILVWCLDHSPFSTTTS